MRRLQELRHSKVFGFTIIIVAILLLAVALLRNGNADPPGTLRTQTNAISLFQAIKGFQTTYNELPRPMPEGGELLTEGKDGAEFLKVLLGKEEFSETMQNKRQIRFLNVEESRMKNKGGLLFSQGHGDPEGLYDSWGNPFRVRFASGKPWEIQDPFKPGEVIRGKVAIVFSYGKNGKPGDKDDVKTW